MARGNPQWRQMVSGGDALVVFNGPHAYVTPSWYRDPMNVPTWNYAVVHASGPTRLVESAGGIEDILKKTVDEFERHEAQPWRYELPEEFRSGLVRGIVGFEVRVTRLEGKFKLSQNREHPDRQGVLEGLATRTDEMSRKTRELMLRTRSG